MMLRKQLVQNAEMKKTVIQRFVVIVKEKIEQTCPKCGGYKFSSFVEYCYDCKDELENNEV